MTLSIAIFIAQRDKHIERPYLREKGNEKEKENTRTLRSFFSFGVSLGLPFFLTFATADLDVSGAREASANVTVSIRPVAFMASSSSFAEASVRACTAVAAERASSDRHFYLYEHKWWPRTIETYLPSALQGCMTLPLVPVLSRVCKQQFK